MNQPSAQLPEELLQTEVAAICQRYRIDPDDARDILQQQFAARPKLLQKIAERYPAEDVTRLSDYRQVIKAVKKQVYYHLRQYRQDSDQEAELKQRLAALISNAADAAQLEPLIAELLSTHVSTQERLPHYDLFYQTLFDLLDPPQTILDLGCGLHPLSYPFQDAAYAPQQYIAIDKDLKMIETLQLYASQAAPTRLAPVWADLATVTWADYVAGQADLTLMLKLIPVIQRHNQEILLHLAKAPSRMLLVTASVEAMTRKQNIRRREERRLRQFIELTGREVVANFEVGSEFGYLLR